jgi:hypothetical protein
MSDTRTVRGTAVVTLFHEFELTAKIPVSANKSEAEEALQGIKPSVEEKRAALLDWVQNASDDDIRDLCVDDYMLDESFVEIPMVSARMVSDDGQIEGELDATGYLEQASDKQIEELIDCDLGGDYPADAIYHHRSAKGDPATGEMDEYIARGGSRSMPAGFEVYVDKGEFSRWLEERRPALVERFNATLAQSTL